VSSLRLSSSCIAMMFLTAGCAHRASAGHSPATVPAVPTAVVRAGALPHIVHGYGRIGGPAGAGTQLGFGIGGMLRAVEVRLGQHVPAGAEIARLDTSVIDAQVAESAAAVAAARAQLQSASVDRFGARIALDRKELARAQALYAAGVDPRKQVEQARAQLAADLAERSAATAQVRAAGAELAGAQARLAAETRQAALGVLRAPFDGVVAAIYRAPGAQVDPGVPIVRLIPDGVREATVDVPVSDIAAIAPGDPARIRAIGTDHDLEGTVIGVSHGVEGATQLGSVEIALRSSDPVAGAAVDAEITVGDVRGAIVPVTAIVADPESGRTVVFVKTRENDGDLRFETRTVRVLASDGQQATVTGVRAGERVAARGAYALLVPSGETGDSGGD